MLRLLLGGELSTWLNTHYQRTASQSCCKELRIRKGFTLSCSRKPTLNHRSSSESQPSNSGRSFPASFFFHMHTMHTCSALPATNGFPAAFIAALLQLAPAVASFVHHNCLPTRADVFSLADALSCGTARLLTDTCIIIFLASANSAADQIANFVVCVGRTLPLHLAVLLPPSLLLRMMAADAEADAADATIT